MNLGCKWWKVDVGNIDGSYAASVWAQSFFSWVLFLKCSKWRLFFEVKVQSTYLLNTFWDVCSKCICVCVCCACACVIKGCVFRTYVTHTNLKCEPHVLFQTRVHLLFVFYFNVWDLSNWIAQPLCRITSLFCFFFISIKIYHQG